MRALRLCLVGTVTLALLGGMSSAVAAQASEVTEAKYVERAWATIRDGVFVDEAEWEERLFGFDPRDKKQARKLRRVVRNHLALLQDVPDYACYATAHEAAMAAAEALDRGLTDILKGRRRRGETTFWEGQGLVNEYWELRGEVDCSTADAMESLPDATPLELVEPTLEPTPEPTPWDRTPDRPRSESVGFTLQPIADVREEAGTWQEQPGYDEETGFTVRFIAEASDPRLSGTWTEVWNSRWGGEATVWAGTVRVENEGGSWAGTIEGFQGPSYHASRTVLEGEDGYTGLTAIMHYNEHMTDTEREGEGVILDFGLPPLPDPPEPSAE